MIMSLSLDKELGLDAKLGAALIGCILAAMYIVLL